MGLVRKHSLYQLALLLWGTLSFGVSIAVFTGNAEPYVTPADLPIQGPVALFGTGLVSLLAGAFVLGRLKRRSWKRTGRAAGLTPDGGFLGTPDLEGTVDGRAVRARTITRRTGSGGEGGSNRTTYTIVEADLAEPTEHGLLVAPGDGTDVGTGSVNVDLDQLTTTVDGVAAVADSDALARDTLTQRVVDALDEPGRLEVVLVGNAADVLTDQLPDGSGLTGSLFSHAKSKIADEMAGDAGTVSTEDKGLVLNATELEAQVAAVAATADSFERAIADAPRDHTPEPPGDDATTDTQR